jgi:pimeloyl-ACP methyl ester carboxylesterase
MANKEILQKNVLFGYRHHPRRNRRAVLFVHGFTGDWETTWKNAGAGSSFLELIAADPKLADFDVFSFSYKASYLSGASIDDVAVQLHRAINQSLEPYQLVLLAHSMGGLVCMRYILDRLEHGDELPVAGLLLYGTPTTGTALVKLAKLLALGLKLGFPWLGRLLSFFAKRNAQIGELEAASAFLQRLHDGWALRVVNGGDPDTDSRYRAWVPVRVVTGIEDWVVPKHSAKSVYGEIDWHPLNYGHVDLVKPVATDDPRYIAAARFFEKGRDTKSSEVLARLRGLSDLVWKERERKLVRDWEADFELTSALAGLAPTLRDAGYAVCELRKCQFTTVWQGEDFCFGIALDEVEESPLWARQPDYVHQLVPSSINEEERGRYVRAFDAILERHRADLKPAWDTFFPALSARLRGPDAKRYALTPGEVERVGRGLLCKYLVPREAADLLGEEVTLELQYQSIEVHSGGSLCIVFPWLTYGCRGRLKITEPVDSLSLVSGLRGQKQLTVNQGPGELAFQAPGLLLPRSWVEVRWNRYNVEAYLRGFLGDQVAHIRAGHAIASNVYEGIRLFVRGLKSFRDEQQDSLAIKENYVINELLYVIADSLPPHSVWLGVSQLTVGWQEAEADPEYRKFVRKVQERSRKGDLKIMRLYCAPSPRHLEEIQGHLDQERAAGIVVRTLVGDRVPRDMTLLWLLSDLHRLDLGESIARPVQFLRDREVKPICGMEFHSWQRRSLNKMSLYSPRSSDFDHLVEEFDDYWRQGAVGGAQDPREPGASETQGSQGPSDPGASGPPRRQGPHMARLRGGKGEPSAKGEKDKGDAQEK